MNNTAMDKIHSYRVLDGDTIEVMGRVWTTGVYVKQSLRVKGVDTPEKSTLAGQAVLRHLKELLSRIEFSVVGYKDDKFGGRFVGDVLFDAYKVRGIVKWCKPLPFVTDNGFDYATLSDYLIVNGLARVYNGDKKQVWTDTELRNVENNCSGLVIAFPVLSSTTPDNYRWVLKEDNDLA